MQRSRSESLYRRAIELMPGGVNSPVRAMRAIGRDPIFIAGGEGGELIDVDGNRYIDFVCSWGPLIHGHRHAATIEAVEAAMRGGLGFGAATEVEVELAAEVCRRFASIEMVRLTSSGTEAAMSALRLARAATGRDTVVKFAGAYHGHVDGLLAEAGSGLATQSIPASPGVTAAQAADTLVVPWNDREALAAAVERGRPAAILAEPIPANMGLVPPREGFLEFLREQADAAGSLLVLDEVISGFRVARGGAQELHGVRADLTILGKVLGGGLPVAAYGGPRALMEQVAPAGQVYQAGTLAGNPLGTAAGLATLRALDGGAYERLEATTAALAEGLREASAGMPVQVVHRCGLLTLFMSDEPVTDFAEAGRCDLDAYGRFCREMLDLGVYPPPSQFEAWFPSLAHDAASVKRTVEAAGQALASAAGP